VSESVEVKLARIEEKLDAFCHSIDMQRASMEKEISDLWRDTEKISMRLTAIEAVELQRKGGKAVLAILCGSCLASGGVLVKIFEWLSKS
jgi:hypothetical protein